jgi:hypothetical protein
MLPPLASLIVQVRSRRGGHEGRERLLGLDRVMLEPAARAITSSVSPAAG